MTECEISVDATNASSVIYLRGEADLASREMLRSAIRTCSGDVVVDLSGATLLDAANVGVLVSEHRRLAAEDGRLSLLGPRGIVELVLHVCGLTPWIDTPLPSPLEVAV